jgi:hypothetical protein
MIIAQIFDSRTLYRISKIIRDHISGIKNSNFDRYDFLLWFDSRCGKFICIFFVTYLVLAWPSIISESFQFKVFAKILLSVPEILTVLFDKFSFYYFLCAMKKKWRGKRILHVDMTFSKKLPRASNGFEIWFGE